MSKWLSVVLALLIVADPRLDDSVRRIDLGEAVLVMPAGYRPRGGRADVMLHLHGAAPVVEKALAESGWVGPLLLFNRKGLSSVYTEPFRDPALFPRLLEKTRKEIAAAWPAFDLKIGRVFVSSFSAGFGGVRELLAVPAHFARIDGVILADSLYAGYLGDDVAKRQIDPAKMAGFRKFAALAAAGRKTMIVTHSAQVPAGYASTTETADDLIGHVGGKALAIDEDWGDGWRLRRRFAKGRFLVLGFAGAGPEDHMRHLRRINRIWRAASEVDGHGTSNLLLSGHTRGAATRTVEVPVGKNGEVQVAEIVAHSPGRATPRSSGRRRTWRYQPRDLPAR